MPEKDETRYIEVVDPLKLKGKGSFSDFVPNLADTYNMNMFTASIPESKLEDYERTCGYMARGNPELYEYMYWRMRLNEQILDWYRCFLEAPTTNFFPKLRNALEK